MVVYDDYGIEWALVALVVFPVTIVVAPILAVMNDPENGFPLFVTAVLIVWTLYAFFKRDRKKALETQMRVQQQIHSSEEQALVHDFSV